MTDETNAPTAGDRPQRPDLPAYVLEPLDRQSPGDLETVARYARALADWKRSQGVASTGEGDGVEQQRDGTDGLEGTDRQEATDEKQDTDEKQGTGEREDRQEREQAEEGESEAEREPVSRERLAALESRGISTAPGDYEDVPASGAYVTVKETKPGYEYYYWQWRDGDRWRNRYIAPVASGDDE
jgi:hypothetical protein